MPANSAEASVARACLAHPALDRLLSSAERIAELRDEMDRRIARGDLSQGTYLRIVCELVLTRSACEAALKDIGL